MTESISDQDYFEDTDSNEEFEKKFQDSIQAHKEASSRPSSSSSRPKTASRFREESESLTNLIATAVLQVYFRISNFISSKKITKSQILSQFGDYVTAEKFKENFSILGFEITDAEVNFIFRESGVPKTGVLRMSDVCSRLINEIQEDEEDTPKFKPNTSNQLVREAQKLLKDSSPKTIRKVKTGKADRSLKRPKSNGSTSYRAQRPPSAPSRNPYVKNYLRQSKAKEYKEKANLDTTLDRCRREYEYEIVRKMGEANEILLNIGSNTTYRCIRKDDRSLKCHIYILENFVEEISLENFLREWKRLKNKKPAPPETTSVQVTSKSSVATAKVKKNERQEELKKLLLETRELTNSLKTQLRVLEQKGIIKRNFKKENISLANSRA